MNGRLTISEIAEKVGVSTKTLIRWEKCGKIRAAKRDWKGWRVYHQEDLADIKKLVNTFYEPEEILLKVRT